MSSANPTMSEPALLPRVFFDTSAVIAGAFSTTGASYILLQLAGLTLLDGRISPDVRAEALRNVTAKTPAALPHLRVLLGTVLVEIPYTDTQIEAVRDYADPKDVRILAAAVAQQCRYLVTLNEKDFWPPPTLIAVTRPGTLLQMLRVQLANL